MNLISEKTIENFEAWAKENEDKSIFSKIHKEGDSYYTNRNPGETYLTEYSFGNMAELKQSMEVYSGLSADSQMLEKLTVEVCKNRNSYEAVIKADRDSLLQKETVVEAPIKSSAKAGRDLRNEKVIEEFQAWAKENKDNTVFSKISKEEGSYYSNRNLEETYLMDYSFQNMAGLKETLGKYSGLSMDSPTLKKLTIEICRDRCRNELKVCERENDREDRIERNITQEEGKALPQYIYVF